ncbi:MAG: ATP-binding cassette domain-containing protein [Phyllobacteriaceae bacterium]|nr:ATP-binding cassette domain-containing protein [Phyllobacteriaceae bacterium]
MLAFEDVSFAIGTGRILAGVDLTVSRGELVVLLGPSGAGKTTILRLAAGFLRPSRGRVANDGLRTAMVFQAPHLLPWESALDNAALPLEAIGRSRRDARDEARRWLARLGFRREDVDKRPAELSGGMQARVAIARAFVIRPDVVLLDEPFAALDPARRRSLQGLLRDLVEESGVSALFVTHDPAEAVRLADRIAILAGTPARVVSQFRSTPIVDPVGIWATVADLARRSDLTDLWATTAPS